MLILSVQIHSGCHGQGPLSTPTTSLVCPPVKHATIFILHFPWGRVLGHLVSNFMRSHPLLLNWPGTSPPHSRAPGGGASAVGDTLTPLLFPLPLTSWNHPTLYPQFPRSAGASGGLCPPQHLLLGCHQRMREPPLSEGYMPLLSAREWASPQHDIT